MPFEAIGDGPQVNAPEADGADGTDGAERASEVATDAPLALAVMTTFETPLTGETAAVKEALLAPAGTVTDAGMLSAPESPESETATAVLVAPERRTEQLVLAGGVRLVAAQATCWSDGIAGDWSTEMAPPLAGMVNALPFASAPLTVDI